MTYLIGEANLQTLNLNLLLHKRAGDWSKDRGYLSEDCWSPQLYKARNAISNFSASVFGQLLGNPNSLGVETAWDLRTVSDPDDYFQFSKPKPNQAQRWGRKRKGKRKKQKKTNLQPLFFLHDNQWHLTGGTRNLLLFCCTLAQPTKVVFLSSSATESTLKETPHISHNNYHYCGKHHTPNLI